MGFMAHPYSTIKVKGGDCLTGAPEIASAAREKEAGVIVIGLPRNMNGTYGPAAEKSRALAEAVKQHSTASVILWDERLTTAAATRRLQETGLDSRAQREVIDQAAAVQILQSWLDAQSL
jgi:putative Holliday junction resolvase